MAALKPRVALVAGLAALLAAPRSTRAGEPVDVTYAGGLLSIHCAGAELADVLEQVGSAVGMALVLDDGVKRTAVTADIEPQPVQAALETLLEGRGVTYAMSLSPDGGKVAQMYVGAGVESHGAAGGTAAGAAASRRPGAMPPFSARSAEPTALHTPIAAAVADDDAGDVDEDDEPSPFAGLADGLAGLPTTAPGLAGAVPGVPGTAPAQPGATQGTPVVPMMLPGSKQPYYPVLDPFGQPIPMPSPAAQPKPGTVSQ